MLWQAHESIIAPAQPPKPMKSGHLLLVWFIVSLASGPALADPAPYSCQLSPDGLSAGIYVTNTLDREASCLVNCKFSTAKYDDNPEITCVKPVPAGKEVEMCILRSSSGERMLKLTASRADCTR